MTLYVSCVDSSAKDLVETAMLKSILVAVDGSPSSAAALDASCSLAHSAQGSLLGLFVKDERRIVRFDFTGAVVGDVFLANETSVIIREEEKNAERWRAHAESAELYSVFCKRCEDAEIRGDFITSWGIAEQGIADESRRADIVVLGNSGKHAGASFLKSGATAKAVVRLTTCPVLIVPAEALCKSFRIVIAFDASPAACRTLRLAAEFAKLRHLDVDVLSVGENPTELIRLQKPAGEYLTAYDLHVNMIQRRGTPHAAILEHVEQSDARYVALGSSGPHHVMESIFGSTTREILDRSAVATLLSA